MTTDLTQGLNDSSLPSETFLDTVDTFTGPSNELIDWVVGHLPPTYCNQAIGNQSIAGCRQRNPVIESSASSPLIDQMPFSQNENHKQHD